MPTNTGNHNPYLPGRPDSSGGFQAHDDNGPVILTTPAPGEQDFNDYILITPIPDIPAIYVYLSEGANNGKVYLSGNTINKSDGSELISIPENADIRKLVPPENYTGDYGYEYKWINEQGTKTTVRIHGVDTTAPNGSNASQGWIVRVMDGKKSMDIDGTYHSPGIFKENSLNYDPVLINNVHIPIEAPTKFPGVK